MDGQRMVGSGLALAWTILGLASCDVGQGSGAGEVTPTGPEVAVHDVTGRWHGSFTDDRGTGKVWLHLGQSRGRFSGDFIWTTSTGSYRGDISGRISGGRLVGAQSGSDAGSGCRIRLRFDGNVDHESGAFGPGGRIVARYDGELDCAGPVRGGAFTADFGHP